MKKPRRVASNPVALAMRAAAVLTPAEQAAMLRPAATALEQLRSGTMTEVGWMHLADASNQADQLIRMGICSGEESQHMQDTAHNALRSLMERRNARGRFVATGPELKAFEDLLWLQRLQLQHASIRELETARKRIVERARQALAGNAGPGVEVIATVEVA